MKEGKVLEVIEAFEKMEEQIKNLQAEFQTIFDFELKLIT